MIDLVTDALVTFLQTRVPDVGTWTVHSLSNADTAPAKDKPVIALIAVDEHEHTRNRPLVDTLNGLQRPPLQLRLEYLLTYVGKHDEAQKRLSRVVSAFHTRPILGSGELSPALAEQVERVTVRLRNTTADERNQIWSALGRNGRLSLFYTVDVAPAPLLPDADGERRIRSHEIDYVGAP